MSELRLEWRSPSELAENPKNWRRHPQAQLAALTDVVSEVGWAGACLFNERTQRLIDGHARRKVALEQGTEKIPVLIGDWDEAAEAKILATLDPLASMAESDGGALDSLLREVSTPSVALSEMIADLAKEAGLYQDEETPANGVKIFDDERIIDEAFHWFRKTGFPYRDLPVWECMKEINKLASTPASSILNTVAAYQVPDTYHAHRFHSSAEGMASPFDSFSDDGKLRKALRLSLEHSKDVETVLWVVNGTQACANFRPGFALALYRKYAPEGATVLDTSTGYGGRLVGFMASGLARYIGIDPNTKTHAANIRMASELGFADKVELHNLPAEDVPHDAVGGRCDFAFTSPPYFRKEHYSDEPTQSWKRYQTGESWRDGFLKPTMQLQYAALKPGCFAVVNIADVKIKSQTYPLVEWTIAAAKEAGFTHEKTEEFPMQRRFGAGQVEEVATEPVLVFRKLTGGKAVRG